MWDRVGVGDWKCDDCKFFLLKGRHGKMGDGDGGDGISNHAWVGTLACSCWLVGLLVGWVTC